MSNSLMEPLELEFKDQKCVPLIFHPFDDRLTTDGDDFRGSINVCTDDQSSKVVSDTAHADTTRHNEEISERSLVMAYDTNEVVDNEQDDPCAPLLPAYSEPKTCQCLSRFTVEPLMFLVMIAFALQSNVTKNLVVEKVCLDSLDANHTAAFCKNVSEGDPLERVIQTRAATIEMYMTIVDTVPAIFISIFIGAFSDKHGRKLPMIFPVVGFLLTTATLGVFSYFMTEIPPELTPLASLPRALGGGLMAMIIMSLSYVSDQTTAEKRTMRVASVEGMILLSQPVGTLLGGWLYKYSYPLVYLISFVLLLFALLYVILCISDTKTPVMGSKQPTSLIRDFFDINNFKETLITILKPRALHGRRHILLLLLVAVIGLLPFFGNSTILYLYTRLRLTWDLTTYSYFAALGSISITFGLLFMAIVLVRILKMPDMALAVVGLLASMTSSILIGFVVSPLMMYLICIPVAFSGGTSLAVRSQVSKLVPREEQGKVFSILGTADTVMPLVASVMYTEIYNATVSTFPGLAFIISASILIVPLSTVVYVFIDMRRLSQKRS